MTGEGILRALVERKFTKKVREVLCVRIPAYTNKALAVITIRIMSHMIPVEKNKIIFLTFRGSYDCNPKWICEEIVRRKLPYQLVWSYRKNTLTGIEDYPEELKLVRLGTLDFFRELCSAGMIIDNGISTSSQFYKKKRNQLLIETWHGSLGIKKPTKDAVKDKKWVKHAFTEGKMTDYCISNSAFEENEVYRVDYWKNTPIWTHGHARNDVLFEKDTERVRRIRKKVSSFYEIGEDERICLYAPTFRDDKDIRPYDIDYEALSRALTERFGGKWVILTRFHYRIYKLFAKKELVGEEDKERVRVINATNYPDIQELAVCTDVAITDYSSWICEYMLTRRPGFLFATDLKKYQKTDRPFFFPLTKMPFPVAENVEQLLNNIIMFDNEKYVKRCNAFLREMGSVDDGHAAERTVDEIEKLLGGK